MRNSIKGSDGLAYEGRFFRARAADDIDSIFAWIARDNPQAAASVVRRISVGIGRLVETGFSRYRPSGRDGRTRELVVAPYIVVYEVNHEEEVITVLAVLHGAQER